MNAIKYLIFFASIFNFLKAGNHGIIFKENKKQWPEKVWFAAELSAGQVFIEKTGLTWQLFNLNDIQLAHDKKFGSGLSEKNTESVIHGHNFKVEFVNAELRNYSVSQKQSEYYNYFLGNDPSKWASDVKAFETVTFKSIYKNIDAKFYSDNENFKYDFIVKAAGNVKAIKLKYSFTDGICLVKNKLIIKTSVGDVTENIPEAYQIINNKKVIVKCAYVLNNENEISFNVDNTYDPSFDLIIDPSVVVASYSGTESVSFGLGVAPEKGGNMYLYSLNITKNYPVTMGAIQSNYAGGYYDCTLSKFNSTGTAKIFSTYIGGNKEDVIVNCVVKKNEIAVFGTTASDTFPIIKNGFQTKIGGTHDYFILKLDTSGKNLLCSTYLGGKRQEGLTNVGTGFNYYSLIVGEMVMDNLNNCYVAGNSNSFDFPVTPGSFKFYSDSTNFGDMVIVKLNSNLSELMWSTYFGGTGGDSPIGIRLAKSGELYCVGTTFSNDFYTTPDVIFPTKGNYQDMVAFNLDGATGQPIASTYLGAKASEAIRFDIDLNDNLYIAATSLLPQTMTATPGAYNNAGHILFYKLRKDLTQIKAMAKFGYPNAQINDIEIDAMNVDSCGYIYFGGFGKPGLPVTTDAFKSVCSTKGNMYLGVFNPDFSSVKFASYFGGAALKYQDHDDGGLNYFDDRGYFYHALCVHNDVPVTPNAYSQYNIKDSMFYVGSNSVLKNSDAFVKIDLNTFVNATSSLGGELRGCNGLTATFVASSNYGTITIIPGDNYPAVNTNLLIHAYNAFGTYTAFVIAGTDSTTCNKTDSIKTIIKVGPPPTKALNDSTPNCLGIVGALNAGNDGSSYLWNTGQTSQYISPQQSGKYYVSIDNGFCSILDSSYVKMLKAEYPLRIPNIITPNNDNVNDYWDFTKYALDDVEFIVYNRWGTPVFKSNSGDTKWNGVNQSGQDLSESTYFWVLNCRSNCKPKETIVQKGFIQIVR